MPPRMPTPEAALLGEKLKVCRLAKGLSTREVAQSLSSRFSVTHATLANYEAGRTAPTPAVLEILASFYGRPLTWFFESGPILSNLNYRNLKSKTKVSDLRTFEANVQRWIEAYWRLEQWLGEGITNKHILFKPGFDATGRGLAEELRKHLNLNDRTPIQSVANLIEDFGVRAIEMPTNLAIDGLAARYGSNYVIVLNPSVANERCRMNAAHELGHVLLGDCDKPQGHVEAASEKRAYEFGSHLLLPQSQLEEAFDGSSMVRLVKTKEYFGISLQAMIYRAEQTRIIPPSTAKWLWIEFAKRKWRENEPGFVRPDRATRFEDLLARALADRRLTWEGAAKVMQVPEDELHLRMNIALGQAVSDDAEGGEGGPHVLTFPAR
jgi:Zn-dependent peptidase ImmA (M78 family)